MDFKYDVIGKKTLYENHNLINELIQPIQLLANGSWIVIFVTYQTKILAISINIDRKK